MKSLGPSIVISSCIAISLAIQPGAAPASPAPLRNLEYGDINFLHTTDTHGWHAGHLLEPSFNADWGDYISFTEHLRSRLEAEGKDLLVVDTGDRIEGNGLYDASIPRGRYTFPIFTTQHIDLLCTGNHELYKNSSAQDDFDKLVPAYPDNYIASNLQIWNAKTGELDYVAQKYRYFNTTNGRRILAFGFIFDFTRNDCNTIVTPVEITVRQAWFIEALSLPADLVVIIGHVALRQAEADIIYHAVRTRRPNTPIAFFGGHFHIRDYRIFDSRAHAIASGRFMETVGFQSISNISTEPRYFRRYIDNNLFSLQTHSHTNASTFSTTRGLQTSQLITESRKSLQLDERFGCAPQAYWMSRRPYPHPDSIYTLLTTEIFPDLVSHTRHDKTRLVMTNTGAIRFDIFPGPFTRDSTYIVSPFTSNLSFIEDVPYALARQLLPILNQGGPQTLASSSWSADGLSLDSLAPPEIQGLRTTRTLLNSDDTSSETNEAQHPFNADPSFSMTPGYTTIDDLGKDGDDTAHSPIQFYDVPNVVQTLIPSSSSSLDASLQARSTSDVQGSAADINAPMGEVVDLVFNEFLMPYILRILNILQQDEKWTGDIRNYSDADVANYFAGETFTTVLAKWIAGNWGENCDSRVMKDEK